MICNNTRGISLAPGGALIGNGNEVTGQDCSVTGNHNVIYGERVTVTGNHNLVNSSNGTVTGNHNTFYGVGNRYRGSHLKFIGRAKTDDSAFTMQNSVAALAGRGNSPADDVSEELRTVLRRLAGDATPERDVTQSQDANDIGRVLAQLNGDVTYSSASTVPRVPLSLRPFNRDVHQRGLAALTASVRAPASLSARLDDGARQRDLAYYGASIFPPSPAPLVYALPAPADEPSAPDDTPDEKLCVICMDRVKTTVVVPCGHCYACITCVRASAPRACQVCKAPVEKVIRKYE